MAGSSATVENLGYVSAGLARQGAEINEYKWSWVSDDAAGSVVDLGTLNNVCGTVVGFRAVPSGGGTAPSDLYDVTINDENGVDVLQGVGANLPQVASGVGNYQVPITNAGSGGAVYLRNATLKLNITNAGNSKEGDLYLYVRME